MATPYMSLVLPIPGTTVGPDWATQLTTALTLIDSHDHSTGKGAAVTPAGLNINADLSFGAFQATDLKTATFSAQGSSLSSSFKHCVYDTGGDLYWNNGSGTAVQLTSGSTINVGSVNGISGLAAPASASFSTPDFVFKSGSTTYGKINVGDIKLYEATAGITNAVTIKSPTTLAASYNLTLPSGTPAASAFVMMDSSGALSTTVNNAAFADSIATEMTTGGAKTIAGKITRVVTTDGSDPGLLGICISPSSGAFFDTSTISWIDVTGIGTVTLTTGGNPVDIRLVSDITSPGYLQAYYPSPYNVGILIRVLRDGATIAAYASLGTSASGSGATSIAIPPESFSGIDLVAAGSHTYKLQVSRTGSSYVYVDHCKLMVMEK